MMMMERCTKHRFVQYKRQDGVHDGILLCYIEGHKSITAYFLMSPLRHEEMRIYIHLVKQQAGQADGEESQ